VSRPEGPAPRPLYPLSLPAALPISRHLTTKPPPPDFGLTASATLPIKGREKACLNIQRLRQDHRLGPVLHAQLAEDAGQVRLDRDRKSTRLNSSHVKISYAVFCLKK